MFAVKLALFAENFGARGAGFLFPKPQKSEKNSFYTEAQKQLLFVSKCDNMLLYFCEKIFLRGYITLKWQKIYPRDASVIFSGGVFLRMAINMADNPKVRPILIKE